MVNFWDAEPEIHFRPEYTRDDFEHDAKTSEFMFEFLAPENQVLFLDRLVIIANTKAGSRRGWAEGDIRTAWEYYLLNDANRAWIKGLPRDRWRQLDRKLKSQAAKLNFGGRLRLLRSKLEAAAGRFFQK